MIIDHVTVHLPARVLHAVELSALLRSLGFREIRPDVAIEKDWDVRWFEPIGSELDGNLLTILHLVADDSWQPQPIPGLSHFCVVGVGPRVFHECQSSVWLEHYSEGSKRLWINYHGLRIEVRA